MQVRFSNLSESYREHKPEFDAAFQRVMDSGRWLLGSELERFESDYAQYTGAQFCVGVANGLDALSLSLRALGVEPNDEVLVPAHTFIATWLAVSNIGAVPVSVEPAPDGFNLDVAGLGQRMSPRTKAVIPVHLYGEVCDIVNVQKFAAAHGIFVVEDAAQAHGAKLDGKAAGTFGHTGCFSFYPGKNLGAFGDGGAVVTSDKRIYDRLMLLRNYGARKKYEHEVCGVNSRLNELQAAALAIKLRSLDQHNDRRRRIAKIYAEELSDINGLILPRLSSPNAHVWHLYVVRTSQREALRAYLEDGGIETGIHYPKPVYRFEPYLSYGPNARSPADEIADGVLSLPMGPHLSDTQARYVCQTIREFFAKSN